jgi:AcrR family transcriptional regulator
VTGLGRPRSEDARTAVLQAVDDLLVEQGYAAMTMKGIAERAGVGRQTVYRWWSSKAEILLEAAVDDATTELTVVPTDSSAEDLRNYLAALERFLTASHAGAAYRALVGEAQHNRSVAALLRSTDPLHASALPLVRRMIERGDLPGNTDLDAAADRLVGPIFFRVLTGASGEGRETGDDAAAFLSS